MTSKLFHTVVAFGITLGAASAGCAAEEPTPASSEAAVVTKDATETKPVEAGKTGEATKEKDRFCEVAWPTTKGGPRPATAQDCIDPAHDCGVYPGGTFSRDVCYEADEASTCDGREAWMFCKETAPGVHAWTCPKGTVKGDQCVWPEPKDG